MDAPISELVLTTTEVDRRLAYRGQLDRTPYLEEPYRPVILVDAHNAAILKEVDIVRRGTGTGVFGPALALDPEGVFGGREDALPVTPISADLDLDEGCIRGDGRAVDGVVILTSNMPNAIDTAFARRMHFVIEFRLPDEEMRKTVWERALTGGMPLGDDIDVPFLAERFEISAANVKNVVMMGAFLAAAEGDILNMRQLVRGMQVEFQKLGKACTRTDFGPYYRHLDLDAV